MPTEERNEGLIRNLFYFTGGGGGIVVFHTKQW